MNASVELAWLDRTARTADGECWHQQKDSIYQAAVIQEEVTDEKIDCEKDLAKAEAAFSETLSKVTTYF